MSKHPSIATPGQEQHMRAWLDALCLQRDESLSSLSASLIGSTRLLDFHRGAPLTPMLLTRVLIGCKAMGLTIHAETLLGPGTPLPLPLPGDPEARVVDPLLTCVECLMTALTELTATCQQLTVTSHQLTTAFTACIQAMQEVTA